MPRIARVVIPGVPHHVTQRGNRCQQTFFSEVDYSLYRQLMAHWCAERQVQVWAYCLMPNHVHMVAVPADLDGLRRAIGEAHRRYTRHVNLREGWRGHLWQGRFASYPMDEYYLLSAARYIELNPVRAGLVASAEQYPWSSAAAHVSGKDDELVQVAPLLALHAEWRGFLAQPFPTETWEAFRRHERTGRPIGSKAFVADLEERTDRLLHRQRPGPKPRHRGVN